MPASVLPAVSFSDSFLSCFLLRSPKTLKYASRLPAFSRTQAAKANSSLPKIG